MVQGNIKINYVMEKKYFLNKDGKQSEPFSITQLKEEYITADTMIWTDGFEDWMKASECPEVSPLISKQPPVIKKPQLKPEYEAKTDSKGNVLYYKEIKSKKTSTDPFAIASFAAGLGGFLILPIIFIPIAYVTSIVSYYRMNQDKSLGGTGFRVIGAILTTINIFWVMYTMKIGFFA